jgi:hypothetical protein
MSDREEDILDQLEELNDELEEIVRAAGNRDHDDYWRDLRIRVRKADGHYFLKLYWYRADPPAASVVYAPRGWWMSQWYKGVDRSGTVVWEGGIERDFSDGD